LASVAGPRVSVSGARWKLLAPSPLGARSGASVTWDGTELIELGGTRRESHEVALSDGAAFNPTTGRWRRIAPAPDHVALLYGATVWTGSRLFVFGGESAGRPVTPCCTAGLFDPISNRWSLTQVPVDQLMAPVAVWTGSRIVLVGLAGRGQRLEVASFDPASAVWTRLDPAPVRSHPPVGFAVVATSRGVLLWSLWSRNEPINSRSFTIYSGIDVFRLIGSGHWTNVTGHWPQHETVGNPIFTGRQILLPPGQIWCGLCSHPAPFNEHGNLVDPSTLRITQIPHGPLDDLDPNVVWTGTEEIAVNLGGEIGGPPRQRVLPGDVAIWNPATRRWWRGPRAPRALQYDIPPIWDGSHMLVLATGGRLLAFGR
jgi:hypothetical protein